MRDGIWSRSAVFLALLTVSFSLAGCGGSGGSAPPQGQQQGLLGGTVDGVAQAEMQQQGIPGMTVALAKNGTVLYTQGYGVSDRMTGQAAQPNLIFEIGSITKQFTASLIMKLQEQGKLHVDDSIAIYLPKYNFPPAITLRMMLNHTSGLADFTNFPQIGDWVRNGVSEATVLTAVSQAPLLFQPGTQYSYSNSNFFALGTIIEELTGQSYEATLDQYIFQPLGLANTYYILPPPSQSASGYQNSPAGLIPAIIWDRSAAFAAGALSTNVYDLINWDNALTHGKIVSPGSFQAMIASDGFKTPDGGTYGFGLEISTVNGRQVVWHNGQIGGFTAENALFLDTGFAVVVLTNDQDADTDAVVLKVIHAVCNSPQLSGNC
jgi:D-alanyl-D-alanine carboxypeptidase